jgi:NAD(P)-dependent dehydrogenase (short-subunit alcohol dehydrogenase family)
LPDPRAVVGVQQDQARTRLDRAETVRCVPASLNTMHIALITGGSRGIGRSAAQHIARRGSAVVVTYQRDHQSASEVVRGIESEGGKAAALELDVADVARFGAFRARLAELLGAWGRDGFDALVHNGGFGMFAPIEHVREADFDALFAVHLKGPFFLTQALLPLLADGGSIVTVTSATTRVATVGVAPYAAFKSGLATLTRYLAKELGPRRIRANAVSPGAIRTELAGGLPDEFAAMLAAQTALGRVGEADDVGALIAMLIGDESRWVNGQSIEASGGYLL